MADRHERRFDIDWLRVFATVMAFLFHCARFFDFDFWHVKNAELDWGTTVFVAIVAQWLMPLFFVLSGISSYYALDYLSGSKYLNARVKRLLIPLIFGAVTHISLQVYLERVTHGQFSGSFFEFYPRYYDGFYAFGGNFAWMGLHLWYLEMLFIFSLLTLPLFLWVRGGKAKILISRAVSLLARSGAIFLLAVPLGVVELLVNLKPESIGVRAWGGWSLFPHLVFFISGYLIASDGRLKEIMERQWLGALLMGLAATTLGYFLFQAGASQFGFYFSVLRAFNAWFWLVAMLGFGSKHLNVNNRALKYASEEVLPFYILHQTVILTIGFYIVDWDLGTPAKYAFLSISSFVAIMAIYDVLVRRFNILRFLFGMKSKRVRAT